MKTEAEEDLEAPQFIGWALMVVQVLHLFIFIFHKLIYLITF